MAEVQELHEQAEKTHENPELIGATFTMSVLAVLVAAVSVLGHRAHTRTILDQTRAADSWSEYQARSIRYHNYELFIDLLSVANVNDAAQAQKLRDHYGAELQRYKQEQDAVQAKAKRFEASAEGYERHAARYDLGEVCLEAALVITSITLITRKKIFWGMGSALAAAGVILAISGFWVH
jgi:ribosome-binding ATPase YchF (GTP1/OBG family)